MHLLYDSVGLLKKMSIKNYCCIKGYLLFDPRDIWPQGIWYQTINLSEVLESITWPQTFDPKLQPSPKVIWPWAHLGHLTLSTIWTYNLEVHLTWSSLWGHPCPYLKLYPTNLTGNISLVTWRVELRLRINNLEKYQ